MSNDDKVFSGSIPEVYDTYLVPLIFESYAEDLAARVAAQSPAAVLETAAGSGVVPRALAPLLAADTRYVVTDLNQPMLDRAQAQQDADDRIEWRQADAQALPFDDASFDFVLCQFGAMFFPDQVGAFTEVRRVLRPDGRWAFNVWDRIERNAFADTVTNAVAECFPTDPPRFLPRTPHGHHDMNLLGEQLMDAGFSSVTVDVVERRSVAANPRIPALAYCQGTPLRNEIEARAPDRLDAITDHAADAVASRFGSGAVDGEIRAYVISATA